MRSRPASTSLPKNKWWVVCADHPLARGRDRSGAMRRDIGAYFASRRINQVRVPRTSAYDKIFSAFSLVRRT
jgi:hypothetical protein